jgi:alpha-beta hydrolase superfamily lysophospholipase
VAPPDQGTDVADESPRLIVGRVPTGAAATALLLHGGAEVGHGRVRAWSGPALRMRPIGWAIRRRVPDLALAYLRYRHRGWNGDGADPLHDVAYAIARLRERNPDLPIILVGHSMGGRAAIHAAGDPQVRGVVALAPWLPRGEPNQQLAGVDLVVIHGTNDRRTSPELSAAFARDADGIARSVRYVAITGGDHAMLRHAPTWHRETAAAVATIAHDTTNRSRH